VFNANNGTTVITAIGRKLTLPLLLEGLSWGFSYLPDSPIRHLIQRKTLNRILSTWCSPKPWHTHFRFAK